MRCDRGGTTVKTGKIGHVNCIRQQLLMPGERMNISINGSVRLETLRERDVMRINAHLGVFMQPLRWLVPELPDYIKEGPDTAITIPVLANEPDWAKLGVGSYLPTNMPNLYKFWQDAPVNVFNNWYKWPEEVDNTAWSIDGPAAVPLSHNWSRCRYSATPDDANDYTQDSATNFDVRDLAEKQAAFRSAMKRDVISFGRWMELSREMYKGSDPSREVEKIPIMLDQVDVGVNPREMPATDGASLGQWQSMYDFQVNHQIRGVTAPEHMVLSYFLTVRFAPIIEGCSPLASDRHDWAEFVADPEYINAGQPVQVQVRDLIQSTSSTELGYLAAGWQWRSGHDVIGQRIDARDSFPYSLYPTTKEQAKDATRVVDAFRSQALGDMLIDLRFVEDSRLPFGDPMDSYFSGMLDDAYGQGPSGDVYPKGGKQL